MIWYFGSQVEAAMDAAAEAQGPRAKGPAVKAARARALAGILDAPGMYRQPTATKTRRG